MRNVILLCVAILAMQTSPAYADQAQAREIARLSNCIPKKVEIFDQKMAADIQTVYRIECNMPKVVDSDSKSSATALLIRCNGSLCRLLRPTKI